MHYNLLRSLQCPVAYMKWKMVLLSIKIFMLTISSWTGADVIINVALIKGILQKSNIYFKQE